MTAAKIIQEYISFFEEQGHVRISNSSLVPENDPSTLFTSSGMQPLVPFFLGEPHPAGKRLVNVQNCFRAQDIDEIGDNRHTTFFRMLGNWSLGDYFKKEQIPWFFEFLTKKLNVNPEKLYVTVFDGFENIEQDSDSEKIWKDLFGNSGISSEKRVVKYGVEKNWWSRTGTPDNMPIGEPGGPDTEVFYDFGTEHDRRFGDICHLNCDCGRYLEIGNSVFMQYKKSEKGFEELPQKNVDFGGGLERLVATTEDKQDMFETSLLSPIIATIEKVTDEKYSLYECEMRIIADHLIAAVFITASGIKPSNKEQGYILRRLVRRAFDNVNKIRGIENLTVPIRKVIESIIEQYSDTDDILLEKSELIVNSILEEVNNYRGTLFKAKHFIQKRHKHIGDELKGITEISADDAFLLYATHGLSPTQIESLGFSFDKQKFAEKMEEHAKISRKGSVGKFAGGLADKEDLTIKGHTATHLMHQALRDVLGESVHQTGSNITTERIRFDFAYDKKLTDEEVKKVEGIVRAKIKDNLPVYFEMMPLKKAKELDAIGLFDDKYDADVKVYFVGDYSVEFCGGPHVDFTGDIKSIKIIKEENLGRGMRRIYAVVE